MTANSALLDILNEDLSVDERRLIVRQWFDDAFQEGFTKQDLARSKTLGPAKSLLDFYDLVRQAIENYEIREGITDENKIVFTEEEPDVSAKNEAIVFSLISREPGAFGEGAPLKARVRNQKPIIREIVDDPTAPGYKKIIKGYWYDNVVRFTCWAKTNKAANRRAEWFGDLMEEYSWWFKLQGVDRVIFLEQQADLVTVVNDNKWYGRPIDYFVRTEKLRVYSEKMLEEILLKVAVTR